MRSLFFCASLVGAGLGFLWFNAYPAQVFMGDVGSLSLGGTLGFFGNFVQAGTGIANSWRAFCNRDPFCNYSSGIL